MTKLKTVIVDDEPFSADLLRHLVEKHCANLEIAGVYTSSEMAVKELLAHPVDLVLLDIEMPRMNGFDMLEQFDKLTFDVVFTTGYDKFAIKAFRYSALNYLLKPIDPDDLKKSGPASASSISFNTFDTMIFLPPASIILV